MKVGVTSGGAKQPGDRDNVHHSKENPVKKTLRFLSTCRPLSWEQENRVDCLQRMSATFDTRREAESRLAESSQNERGHRLLSL
jgi:hypothetical protein